MAMSTSEECAHLGRGNEGIRVGSSDSRHSPLPAQVPLRRGQPWPSGEWTGQACRLQGGLGSLWRLAVEDSEEVPLVLQKSHPLVTPGPLVGIGCVSGPGRTHRTVGKTERTPQPLVQEPSWPRRKVGAQVSWYPAGALTTHALQSRG